MPFVILCSLDGLAGISLKNPEFNRKDFGKSCYVGALTYIPRGGIFFHTFSNISFKYADSNLNNILHY